MPTESVALQTIGVKNVKTSDLLANPHNPRRLFDRVDMEPLKASIGKVGILVPLTVYLEGVTGKYRILDGQRRWICAQELGFTKVPVNEVAEPSLVQNIVTMFQIHKLRRDWELMPTALKLEVLMNEIADKADSRIAALTGLDVAVVVRCKKLLWYSRHYQDMMLDIDPTKRIKADFFIELYAVLTDRWVKKFSWFHKNKFIDRMLAKHKAKALKSVTEFRTIKQHINNAAKSNRIGLLSRKLEEFAENAPLTVEYLAIENVRISTTARKIEKNAITLLESVADIDVDGYYGENKMWESLENLSNVIRQKLRKLGRRVD